MDSTRDSSASISSCKLLWKRKINKNQLCTTNWARFVSTQNQQGAASCPTHPRSGCRIYCRSDQTLNPARISACESSRGCTDPTPGPSTAQQSHKPWPPPASPESPPGSGWWRHPQSGRGSGGSQHHPAAWCHHRHPPGSAAASVCQDTESRSLAKAFQWTLPQLGEEPREAGVWEQIPPTTRTSKRSLSELEFSNSIQQTLVNCH